MKKTVAAVLCFMLALSVAGCGSKSVPDKPFETENIRKISFKPGPNDWVEVPAEELPFYIDWLASFRVGEKVRSELAPGSNSVRIRIEYSDGTFVETGMSTIKVGKNQYHLTCDNAPETYLNWQ